MKKYNNKIVVTYHLQNSSFFVNEGKIFTNYKSKENSFLILFFNKYCFEISMEDIIEYKDLRNQLHSIKFKNPDILLNIKNSLLNKKDITFKKWS